MNMSISRRSFLTGVATAGAVAAAPTFVPSSVLGRTGAVPPSEQITVGFIGTGSHGIGWNLRAYLAQPDARVVAVCDVDSQHHG